MKRYLFELSKQYKNRAFIYQEGEENVTFEMIDKFFSKSIEEKIFRKVILCFCNQTAACIAGFLAIEQIGGVPMMVSVQSSLNDIRNIIELYDVCYFWMPLDKYMDVCSEIGARVICKFREYVLIERTDAEGISTIVHEDLALLLSTSGSTGEKKFVRLSYKNIKTSVEIMQLITNLGEEDRGAVYLPTEHCFTIGLIHLLLSVAGSVVCVPKGVMGIAREGFIDKYKISILISVTFIINFLRRSGFFNVNHPFLRIIANGAGATPREVQDFLVEYMDRQGGRLIPTYGQTEVTIVASAVPKEALVHKYGSIGIPYGDIEMSINQMDDEGVGELVIRSEAVMMGYAYDYRDLMLGVVTGNIIHTGDLAVCDKDGFYYIKGRCARFAKIVGKRISLQLLEEKLGQEFAPLDFACVSDDKEVAVLVNGAMDKFIEIRTKAAEIAGVHEIFVKCFLCKEIPRNETGKIQYPIVKKMIYGE